MKLIFNLRDAKARDWDGFWKASQDPNTPIERFGFAMNVLDLTKDAERIATALRERMGWVKATLRAEDLATMRKNYQAVKDCKSNRAIGNAERTLARTDRIVGELARFVNEMMN
jgi:hypothetical protein